MISRITGKQIMEQHDLTLQDLVDLMKDGLKAKTNSGHQAVYNIDDEITDPPLQVRKEANRTYIINQMRKDRGQPKKNDVSEFPVGYYGISFKLPDNTKLSKQMRDKFETFYFSKDDVAKALNIPFSEYTDSKQVIENESDLDTDHLIKMGSDIEADDQKINSQKDLDDVILKYRPDIEEFYGMLKYHIDMSYGMAKSLKEIGAEDIKEVFNGQTEVFEFMTLEHALKGGSPGDNPAKEVKIPILRAMIMDLNPHLYIKHGSICGVVDSLYPEYTRLNKIYKKTTSN